MLCGHFGPKFGVENYPVSGSCYSVEICPTLGIPLPPPSVHQSQTDKIDVDSVPIPGPCLSENATCAAPHSPDPAAAVVSAPQPSPPPSKEICSRLLRTRFPQPAPSSSVRNRKNPTIRAVVAAIGGNKIPLLIKIVKRVAGGGSEIIVNHSRQPATATQRCFGFHKPSLNTLRMSSRTSRSILSVSPAARLTFSTGAMRRS